MFGMLRMAFTLLICILIVGFYLGWFSFSQSPSDPQSNKVNVNVSVDKNKVGSDLQKFEQNVAKRIQGINNQPQANTPAPPLGQQSVAPGLNFGPISVQPTGQPVGPPSGQPAGPAWSVGPFSVQPAGPPSGQPAGPPQIRLQTQDYQFSVPLGAPLPGEGR
ncbi:MAG: hypothetical protein WCJ35_06230 [Planctomycetota bacterium]